MTVDDQHDEDKLDEALDETFPASDSPGNTVETGIRADGAPASHGRSIVDNQRLKRLELTIDGRTAFLTYGRTADAFTVIHTEVPPELRGRHLGDALVERALEIGRSAGLRIVVLCPFARNYLRKHPPSR